MSNCISNEIIVSNKPYLKEHIGGKGECLVPIKLRLGDVLCFGKEIVIITQLSLSPRSFGLVYLSSKCEGMIRGWQVFNSIDEIRDHVYKIEISLEIKHMKDFIKE